MCLGSLAVETENGEQRGCCARLWLRSTAPSSQTILTLFCKGLMNLGPLWVVNSYRSSLHREHFSLIPITFPSLALFFLFSKLLNGFLHPVFHDALTVSAIVMRRQDLGLK